MEQSVSFQIKAIELLDVALTQQQQALPEQFTFNFNIGLEHKINPENQFLIVIGTVKIIHQDGQTQLASLKASCIFQIQDFFNFLDPANNNISIPQAILTTLNSVTVSTIRGIMFAQFRGTYLHNAVLPVINPQDFNISQNTQ